MIIVAAAPSPADPHHRLPMFSPLSMPISAAGELSMPSGERSFLATATPAGSR